MRQRTERRLRKRLRSSLRPWHRDLAAMVALHERSGSSLQSALQNIMLDPGVPWLIRGIAAQLLGEADEEGTVAGLMRLFHSQTGKNELWETALTLEWFGAKAAVRPLIPVLNGSNPDRRHAAARALGWIPNAGAPAANALIRALLDKTQPQPVREEAAESLAYVGSMRAIPPLVSVLAEPDVRIRFWAVFALGSIGKRRYYAVGADARAVAALESMLGDEEVPPGNWWSVGREALAMLGDLDPKYRAELIRETKRVQEAPNASPEDRRWAEGYCE